MWEETKDIFYADWDFLPLKTYTNIHEGNALTMDWNKIIPSYACHYIMGNPPFVGYTLQSKSQKEDLKQLFKDVRNLDYVAGWFLKACGFIANTNVEVAFVATNSIIQGEQVISIWKNIMKRYNIVFNFAYRTFKWNSEASEKAHVYVVIIGFSDKKFLIKNKKIYTGDSFKLVQHINPYLLDMDDIFIQERSKPLGTKKIIIKGSQPTDHGNLILKKRKRRISFKRTKN